MMRKYLALFSKQEKENLRNDNIKHNHKFEKQMRFYENARLEITQRSALRDQALIAYILAVGAFFSYVYSLGGLFITTNDDIAKVYHRIFCSLAAPFISLTFTLIILQHINVAMYIGSYISSELNIGIDPPNWDASKTLKNASKIFFVFESFAQATILCLPSMFGILFYCMSIGSMHHLRPDPTHVQIAEKLTKTPLRLLYISLIDDVSISSIIVGLHIHSHFTREKLANNKFYNARKNY